MPKTQTTKEKKWVLRPQVSEKELAKYPEMHPYLVQVLHNRNIKDQAEIDYFINPDYGRDVLDPFGFSSMEKTTDRIIKAIGQKEKIVVYGDYDADGVTAAVIMMELLIALGAKPTVYLPYRQTEGYGLNEKAIKELHDKKTDLIITVDCGTTNLGEIELANKLGMTVIIIDHHQKPAKLPPAYAIINSSFEDEPYPFRSLTAGGLAFKVASALLSKTKYGKKVGLKKPLPEGWEKWFLDLVAISTVADMAPLLGENRVLVAYGLTVLKKTRRLGLQKLYDTMKIDPETTNTSTISWQIGPRLNAAGRMDHASAAYQLLITNTAEEAAQIAEDLEKTNRTRQQLTDKMVKAGIEQIGEVGDRKILFAFDKTWQIGVVGLVAGKIMDRYHLPVIAMGMSGQDVIGSGRSVPIFNIVENLQMVDKYLDKYGGHPQACGFTLKYSKDRSAFMKALSEQAEQALSGMDTRPLLEIDAQIELTQVNWSLVEELAKLEPFGQGNHRPLFVATGLEIKEIQTVGKEDKHLRLMVCHNSKVIFKTIGFSFGSWSRRVRIGEKVDMVFEIDINEWNGKREIQLKTVDIKLSDND
ncbi:MAG: single-stranded-DNA-specific exonuclease RecJ [Patescibacteria group bacterium]